MSDLDREWDRLPIAELHQLDALCDRFEQAIIDRPETRIEEFISDLPESQRRLVVRELMQVELERRAAHGETVAPDEYARRFPKWADELQQLASEVSGSAGIGLETIDETAASEGDTTPSAGSWADEWRASTAQFNPADLPADGVLGHYRLQSVIGRGGMGLVVRARDTKLARDVAIKILAPQISCDASASQRFLREAQAVAAVQHKHVVTIHAVETIDHILFLVMEFVNGPTLEEHLRSHGKLAINEVVALAHQMAQGLAAAHKQKLIHRDVKPANILLEQTDATWHVKLTDFGLARFAAEARLTGSGMIAGTPQYMSPEQANGLEIDCRSDLFSLGSVMYTMCAGRPPFETESAVGVLRQVADRPACPLCEVNPEIPGWLIAIIEKLMAKSPDDRFQSAGEVAEALGRHSHEGISRSELAPVPADAEPTEVNAFRRITPRRPRTIALMTLTVAGIAAAAIFVGKFALESGDRADSDATPIISEADAGQSWPVDAPAPAIAPFDAKLAKAHQAAWAKHLEVPVEDTNSVGMKMVLIPPGEFLMGTDDAGVDKLRASSSQELHHLWRDEGPQHRVTITQPFVMSRCEVTRGQFRTFAEETKYVTDAEKDGKGGYGLRDGKRHQDAKFSWSTDVGFVQGDNQPVLNVSWNDATAFCKWLSAKEGVTYRLPSEAEWEYACRAGTTKFWHCGEIQDVLEKYAWINSSEGGRTHPVGQLEPNPWSLCDMHGNVWEWCADWHNFYTHSPAVDPRGPKQGSVRVFRGGSWSYSSEFSRSAIRFWEAPDARNAAIGFRVAAVFSASKHDGD